MAIVFQIILVFKHTFRSYKDIVALRNKHHKGCRGFIFLYMKTGDYKILRIYK